LLPVGLENITVRRQMDPLLRVIQKSSSTSGAEVPRHDRHRSEHAWHSDTSRVTCGIPDLFQAESNCHSTCKPACNLLNRAAQNGFLCKNRSRGGSSSRKHALRTRSSQPKITIFSHIILLPSYGYSFFTEALHRQQQPPKLERGQKKVDITPPTATTRRTPTTPRRLHTTREQGGNATTAAVVITW